MPAALQRPVAAEIIYSKVAEHFRHTFRSYPLRIRHLLQKLPNSCCVSRESAHMRPTFADVGQTLTDVGAQLENERSWLTSFRSGVSSHAWIWANLGRIGMARRDEKPAMTPLGSLGPQKHTLLEFRTFRQNSRSQRTRTRPVSPSEVRLAPMRLASLVWDSFSSFVSARTRKFLAPRVTGWGGRETASKQAMEEITEKTEAAP